MYAVEVSFLANVVKVSYDETAYHDGIAAAVGKPGEDVYVYAENAAAAWWTVSDDPPERAAGSALATGLRWWPPEARRRRLVDTLDGTLLHVLATIRTSAETAAPLVAAVANLTADVYTLGNATGATIKEVAAPHPMWVQLPAPSPPPPSPPLPVSPPPPLPINAATLPFHETEEATILWVALPSVCFITVVVLFLCRLRRRMRERRRASQYDPTWTSVASSYPGGSSLASSSQAGIKASRPMEAADSFAPEAPPLALTIREELHFAGNRGPASARGPGPVLVEPTGPRPSGTWKRPILAVFRPGALAERRRGQKLAQLIASQLRDEHAAAGSSADFTHLNLPPTEELGTPAELSEGAMVRARIPPPFPPPQPARRRARRRCPHLITSRGRMTTSHSLRLTTSRARRRCAHASRASEPRKSRCRPMGLR